MIGLDDLDRKILGLLGEEPAYPSEISRKLGALRTTVQYRLCRLHKSGLAFKVIRGRKSIWRAIYQKPHNKNRYRVYVGRDIVHAYKELFTLPRHTVIFAIQGSDAARGEFDSLPPLFIRDAHRILKRKGIIMKVASNEQSLGAFDALNDTMVRSHIGRTQGVKIFSGNIFLSAGEIMSTEKLLLLSNPKLGFVLVIKERGITAIVNDTLKTLFEFLDDYKTFDLNRYLNRLR